jgi:hypothetical protein
MAGLSKMIGAGIVSCGGKPQVRLAAATDLRSEATPKMTPHAKTLCKSHTINSRASKKSEATYRYVI